MNEDEFNKFLDSIEKLTPQQFEVLCQTVGWKLTPPTVEIILGYMIDNVKRFDTKKMKVQQIQWRLTQAARWLAKRIR